MDVRIVTDPETVPNGALFLDSHLPGVQGALDHHLSGETTNLDLVLQTDPVYFDTFRTLASTHVDSDSVLSAAAIIFGIERLSSRQRAVMRAACLWCDTLRCDTSKERCREGLRLHFHLKEKGLRQRTALEQEKGLQGAELSTALYRSLVAEALCILRSGRFPTGSGYGALLARLRAIAAGCLVSASAHVAFFQSDEYLDPLATYPLHDSVIQVLHQPTANRFEVGLSPRYYGTGLDLRPAIVALNAAETRKRTELGLPAGPAWGGRQTAFGSPRASQGMRSSELQWYEVLEILEALRGDLRP